MTPNPAMRLSISSAQIVLLLVGLLGLVAVVSTAAGHLAGDRVYLFNGSKCALAVMSQHEGVKVLPGETVLVKEGLMDSTPTMVISPSKGIWFGGVHFRSAGKLSVRGIAEVTVPPSLQSRTLLGTEVTYEITPTAQIVVHPPGTAKLQSQPPGFPIESNIHAENGNCGV